MFVPLDRDAGALRPKADHGVGPPRAWTDGVCEIPRRRVSCWQRARATTASSWPCACPGTKSWPSCTTRRWTAPPTGRARSRTACSRAQLPLHDGRGDRALPRAQRHDQHRGQAGRQKTVIPNVLHAICRHNARQMAFLSTGDLTFQHQRASLFAPQLGHGADGLCRPTSTSTTSRPSCCFSTRGLSARRTRLTMVGSYRSTVHHRLYCAAHGCAALHPAGVRKRA
jgi:hypothetical protein